MTADVIERFRTGDLTFGVVGLGYAGLPLAVEAAHSGIDVVGFDVAEHVVDGVLRGRSHIRDLTDEDVEEVVRSGRLTATTDPGRLSECDAISICVPTPLSKTRDPDVSYVLEATEAVKRTLCPGQLIVLESTTYPGTTRELLLPILSRGGLVVGQDFFLCFSPERVDPGNPSWGTRNTPKVIGGATEVCRRVGEALYGRFIDTVVPVSSCEVAELTKLHENTFRAVNIALANELAIVADRLGVNVWEVIDAAATKPFGFMRFTPGPGLGGHCIPVDPHYLSWKMRSLNYRTRFIELASEVNSEMPHFLVGKVREALNASRKAVRGSRILLLGVSYKRDVDDVRESPAVDVLRLLVADGAEVQYHDPFVPTVSDGDTHWSSVPLDPERLQGADAVAILTDHSSFDYRMIVEHARTLVDGRNATARIPGFDSPSLGRWIVKQDGP